MFVDRKKELALMEELFKKQKPSLLILYGRRRVGKSELLRIFAQKHGALYLLARQEGKAESLKNISAKMAEFFKDDVLGINPLSNFDAVFAYLAKKGVPLIFDEFPYLVESAHELPSILQQHWDEEFSRKGAFIVLCGSSIRMMETLLGYSSPLYGRRTTQILLEPLKFPDACEFFGNKSDEEKVVLYSILGGTPAYLLEFDYSKGVLENIGEKMLKKTAFLHQDAMFVLREELPEPRLYFSIVKAIAEGASRAGEIVTKTGLEKNVVAKYLDVLRSLHIVRREVPITEKHPEKSRKGIYALNDGYFRFWFRFVFGNLEYVEQGKQNALIDEKIAPQLAAYAGKPFEEIAREWLAGRKEYSNYLFGKWWEGEEEIDICGIDEKNRRIILLEVKWRDLGKTEAESILARLAEKSGKIRWNENQKATFGIVARSLANKRELRQKGYAAFELSDIMGKGD